MDDAPRFRARGSKDFERIFSERLIHTPNFLQKNRFKFELTKALILLIFFPSTQKVGRHFPANEHVGRSRVHLKIATRSILIGLFWAATAVMTTAAPVSMIISGPSSPPIGAYEFCNAQPKECRSGHGESGPLVLDEERWQTLVRINHLVNSTIAPRTDDEIYGVEEKWTYPKTEGDCEDFALMKRKLLIEAGFPPATLLMTVVLVPNGEGHAVLSVRTDHGDFILDELRNKILLWSDTEYTYVKRQSSSDMSRWMKLQDGRANLVGTVR